MEKDKSEMIMTIFIIICTIVFLTIWIFVKVNEERLPENATEMQKINFECKQISILERDECCREKTNNSDMEWDVWEEVCTDEILE